MDVSRKVLAGFDGSVDSRSAVEYAAAAANDLGLPLQIVHCYRWAERQAPVVEAADRELRAVRESLAPRYPGLAVEVEAISSSPATALLERSTSSTMVVVGYQGAGAYRGVHTSAVSRRVATQASCPATIIRGSARRGPVVVHTDQNHNSTETIGFAFAEAARRGAELVVLLPTPGGSGNGEPPELSGDEVTRWRSKYPNVPVERRSVPPAGAAQRLVAASAEAKLVIVERSNSDLPLTLLAASACPVTVIDRAR